MKRTFILIGIVSASLSLAVYAKEQDGKAKGKGKAPAGKVTAKAAPHGAVHAGGNIQHARGPGRQPVAQFHANVAPRPNVRVNAARQNIAVQNAGHVNTNRNKLKHQNVAVQNAQVVNQQNAKVRNFQRTNTAQAQMAASAHRTAVAKARVVNNWSGQNFSGQNYAAFRDYRRQRHDRSWWTSHYNRISNVRGGWYYWDSGYWYPAWGYDYSYDYPYDGPIYGYNDLPPDQVVSTVQRQLQEQGYYEGEVDGVLGRQTRRAIAAFQADHGLAVTSAIDQPTLASLGLA